MLMDEAAYASCELQAGDPILQMSDFNGLIALSQKHQAPVFALTDEQLEQTGIVLERTKESMNRFRGFFEKAADRILELLSYDSN